MQWLTSLLALIEKIFVGYKHVEKEKKKDDLRNEIRERDSAHTVDELRKLGL